MPKKLCMYNGAMYMHIATFGRSLDILRALQNKTAGADTEVGSAASIHGGMLCSACVCLPDTCEEPLEYLRFIQRSQCTYT